MKKMRAVSLPFTTPSLVPGNFAKHFYIPPYGPVVGLNFLCPVVQWDHVMSSGQ